MRMPDSRPLAPFPAEPRSRFGSLVVIYTHVGELTLDGEAIYFHESLAGAFSRAGFVVDSSGRRLLGVLDVIGMFNTISKAAQEALARDPTADVPSKLPAQFAAKVVFTEACDDKLGRSYGVCELPDGKRVDWLSRDIEVGPVMQWEEVQHSLTMAGRRYAKETATSSQWPGQSVTTLYNETHKLVFQTYQGVNYHCDLSSEPALRDPPSVGDGVSVTMVGYKEVEGVYCRHFQMTAPIGSGPPQTVHLYEDYTQRRILAIRFGNMRWFFANLTAIASEAENPLAPQDLDMEAVLRTCSPKGLAAPRRIVRGLLTARLDTDPEWGKPLANTTGNGTHQLNASLPFFEYKPGQPPRRAGKKGLNTSDADDDRLRRCSYTKKTKIFTASASTCTPSQLSVTLSAEKGGWRGLCPIFSGSIRPNPWPSPRP
jgi:hypothetical protein